MITRTLIALSVAAGAVMATPARAAEPSVADVVKTYADIAQAGYEDSLATARALEAEVDAFLAKPTAEGLEKAREAWIAARVPYQQTEVYRFGNAIVDDWEGKVNAWPLDEGLIDYVDTASYGQESDENAFYAVNVIANTSVQAGGEKIDTSSITPELLESLQEVGGIEANVATGYHAVEFLLWGQDLNGTGAGAGKRPYTDFDTSACTGGNCDRRAAYLKAAIDLLIRDLEDMAKSWAPGGEARETVEKAESTDALTAMLTGMGSLSYGELAGERMKLGLMLHDPEEEHDCFSDNTHASHFYDALGIKNVFHGRYARVDGSEVKGPSLADLLRNGHEDVAKELESNIDATMTKMAALVDRAEKTERYDQMLASGNDEGNAVVQGAVDALVSQTKSIEKAVKALGLTIAVEGSDSLDAPEKVGQ